MLLGNYLHQNRNTVREIGIAVSNPFARFKHPHFAAFYTGEPTNGTSYSSFPDGTSPPEAWHLAPKAGGMSARLDASGTTAADALAVKLAEAALTGSGTVSDAFAGLIVQAVAALSGSGAISNADLKAFLQAVASLSGSGSVSATLGGLAALQASLTASGAASGTLTGTGAMAADLVVTGTGLTTANVGQAVWAAVAASNNTAGTMGEKLNDAGSASNPWTEVIESGYTAAEILRLIAAVVQGDATGLEGAAPVFKSIDGSKNRVEATYTDGDRAITDRDAT